MTNNKKRIAVFASGNGSNFKCIYNNTRNKIIHGEIALLVTNNPKCGSVEFANKENIEVLFYKNSSKIESYNLIDKLINNKIDLIVLAGYLKLVPSNIITEFKNRIINIHPALLPQFGGKGFYGMNIHKAVIEAKVEFSGVTIHFVDNSYDTGPIIIQSKVPIEFNDTPVTLAARILKEEHRLYSIVIKAFCEEDFFWDNNKPSIKELN